MGGSLGKGTFEKHFVIMRESSKFLAGVRIFERSWATFFVVIDNDG